MQILVFFLPLLCIYKMRSSFSGHKQQRFCDAAGIRERAHFFLYIYYFPSLLFFTATMIIVIPIPLRALSMSKPMEAKVIEKRVA